MLIIPLSNLIAQTFSLPLSDSTYEFSITFNSRQGVWTLDIYSQGLMVVAGVYLVGGTSRLKAHPSVEIKNMWLINTETEDDPTDSNLGVDSRLIILEESETIEAAL